MMQSPNPADVPVVVLCGGQGTRIREASEKLPKPLIEIGGRPILWHIMKMYEAHGFRKFVLCLGYKSWSIKQYFLQYEDLNSDLVLDLSAGTKSRMNSGAPEDWQVTLVDTGVDSGTGERLRRVADYLDNDFFMVTYGDGVGDVDLRTELATLAKSDLTGLVTGVHPTSRYGELGTDGTGMVTNFAEKPPSESWVSGGFFAFRTSFLNYLPTDDPGHFFEREPIQKLTRENQLGLYPHSGFWMGMDTYREYRSLNQMWDDDQACWKVW